jgi:hypothetical protein
MRVCLVLAAAFLLGAPCLPIYQPNDEPTAREYEVLSPFCLRLMNPSNMPCMMEDSTWTAPLGASVLRNIGRTSSLARDSLRKNREAAPLDAERVAKAFHRRDGQRFSRVGFSARGDSALVQVLIGGRGHSFVLVRRGQDGWWTVVNTFKGRTLYGL